MSTAVISPAQVSNQVPDQLAVPTGAPEELAGPPHPTTEPVTQAERFSSVDTLRGFALMGILLMNITAFGMPGWNYMFPLTTVKPVFNGPHWQLNTAAWFLRWIFAEGKMRALFSMLFGAGVILLSGRAERRGAGLRTADIFLRRNMWLTVFGMIHAYLIWNGDILFYYGTTALLFLFPFRNLSAKKLLWTGGIVLLLNTVLGMGAMYIGMNKTKAASDKALAAQVAHHTLNDDQKDAIKAWEKIQGDYRPDQKKLYKDIATHQHGFFAVVADEASDTFKGETQGEYTGFADWLGMMLVGMGLLRVGFFTLKLSTRTYALIALIGLGVSWPVVGYGCYQAWHSGFDLFTTMRSLAFTYDLGRIGGALGNAALILLCLRAGLFRWLWARVAAVGQMALSNYILTSLTMKTLFVWSPLHWYGYMDYYKLYLCVGAMWIANIIFSTLWLQHFRFGPLEWAWRSLTYWQRQPMRLNPTPTPPALAQPA